MNINTFDFFNVHAVMLLGILGSFALIILCCLIHKEVFSLSYIGRKSMDIMILHYPPIRVFRLVHLNTMKQDIVFFLVLVFCTLLLTSICLLISTYLLQPIRNKTNLCI